MLKSLRRAFLRGTLCAIVWVATDAWAQTVTSPAPAQGKLERLKIAVAPIGYDTNFTWLNPRSGNLDKRPALEFLVGIDRHTGAYIPELAAKWEMSPDGKNWTISLRKGVKFHEHWGEFTARDVRHAVFLITQPESVQSDASTWRTLMGIGKTDSLDKPCHDFVYILGDFSRLWGTDISPHISARLKVFWYNICPYPTLCRPSPLIGHPRMRFLL